VDDDSERHEQYTRVRIGGAIVLFGVVALIVLADSLNIGRPVNEVIVFGLLITAAGLLAVELPALKR
jgi:hypothetical protein